MSSVLILCYVQIRAGQAKLPGIWVLKRRIMGSRVVQMKQPHQTLQAPTLALNPNQSRHPPGFRVAVGFQESSEGSKHAAWRSTSRSGLMHSVAEQMFARSSFDDLMAGRSASILSSSPRRWCQSCGHGSTENGTSHSRTRGPEAEGPTCTSSSPHPTPSPPNT